MLKTLLERNIATADHRLMLVAPSGADVPVGLDNVRIDAARHGALLHDVQRLRGRIYVADGAVRRDQLSVDGRHETPEDPRAWHLLVTDDSGATSGCIWYLEHSLTPKFDDLRVRTAEVAHHDVWGTKLRSAVAADIALASSERVRYAEVGGWAVDRNSNLTDCLLLILGLYGFSQLRGGAFVLATATLRHASAAVLRRLGGAHIQGDGFTVPPYYDSKYDCQMELLRFDTRRPNPKFSALVGMLKQKFATVPVMMAEHRSAIDPVMAAAALPFAVRPVAAHAAA